jgi:hypothetical protein
MAALIYWVDGVDGNDANAGTSYAEALATIGQAATTIIAAGDGNDFTLLVVNSGEYTLSGLTSVQFGSAFVNSTILVRGVDNSGAAAPVTISANSAVATAQAFIRPQDFGSVIVENFIFNANSFSQNVTHYLVYWDGTNAGAPAAGAPEVRYCYFSGGTFGNGNFPSTGTFIAIGHGASNTHGSVHHCVYENIDNVPSLQAASSFNYEWHHNVIISDHEDIGFAISAGFSNSATRMAMYSNTIILDYNQNTTIPSALSSLLNTIIGASPNDEVGCYDNVFWLESPVSATTSIPLINGNGTTTGTTTVSGFNMFYYGPNYSSNANISAVTTYDDAAPWFHIDNQLSGADTDIVVTGLSSGDVFSALYSKTYNWTPLGASVSYTIPDVRLIRDTTAGSGGTAPGALDDTNVSSGIITVSPSVEIASWTISGTTSFSDTGSSTFTAETGEYTITWESLAGYRDPSPLFSSNTLVLGGTIEFGATYTDTGATITVSPSLEIATWTLDGAVVLEGTGSTVLNEQATGTTTIVWGNIAGYITPNSGSTDTVDGGNYTFVGSYARVGTVTAYLSGWTVANPDGGIDTKFDPTNIRNYFNYEFVIWSGTNVISVHTILGVTATSSYVTFVLSGDPAFNVDHYFALSPTRSAKENFFVGNSYERNLVEGYPGRINTWPSHSAVTDLLLFNGTDYDTFLETELAWALSADTVGTSPPTNVMWRKLVPDGMKYLDNDDQVLQKFVLTLGMSFDKIKQYQDQLAFAHTIGYQDYDHVPRNLVHELARLWGWSLSHDSQNNDLTTYRLAVYDHYATGTTDAVGNLSAADINFERWRRITSNLVRIWKAKGTRKAIELVLNVYGIPSSLLVLKEYVYFTDPALSSWLYLREVPTGVFVVTGESQTRQWIDPDDASISTITNYPIYNARFLDVGVAESEAIFQDVYDWIGSTDRTLIDVNGVSIELSAFTDSRYDFEVWLIQNFVPSDGSHRMVKSYPLLEAIYSDYLAYSSNVYKFGDFEHFISFIEENFLLIVRQLIPASSRLLAQGVITENLPWHREKYVWEPEGDIHQPFNEEQIFNVPSISGEQQTKVNSVVMTTTLSGVKQSKSSSTSSISNFLAESQTQKSAILVINEVLTTYQNQYDASIDTAQIQPQYIEQQSDIHEFAEVPSGVVFQIDTPSIIAYSADSGSVIFTAFNSSALIVTNDNKFDLYLSASNMSDSGMNRVVVQLFRKLNEDDIAKIRTSAFTVMQTAYESSNFQSISNDIGTYKLNSVHGLAIGDIMSATSALGAYINNTVKIVNIYTGTNKIVTSPPIGVDNLPIGKNAARIGLRTLFNSSVVTHLIRAIEEERISYDVIMEVIGWLYTELPGVEDRNLIHVIKYTNFLNSLVKTSREIVSIGRDESQDEDGALSTQKKFVYITSPIPQSQQTIYGVFAPFYQFTIADLAGCAIAVPFLRDNVDSFTLSSDRIYIPDLIVNKIAQVQLQKINNLFDWAHPVQEVVIHQYDQNNWDGFPISLFDGLTSDNNRAISGSIEIGGLDSLNANILNDKEEYFLRYKADAEVGQEFSADTYFSIFSGRNMVSSNWPLQVINNVYYYGNYFIYMKTSKEPIFDSIPTESGATATASVEIQFKGIGDSNQIEVQFLDAGPAPDSDNPNSGPSQTTGIGNTAKAYTAITTANWASATTINTDVKTNADDRTQYTLQTTLDVNRWYWWRVRNSKQKLTIFGYTLESITHSEPKLFFTGDYKDIASEEGENPEIPTPPADDGGGSGGGGKGPIIESG